MSTTHKLTPEQTIYLTKLYDKVIKYIKDKNTTADVYWISPGRTQIYNMREMEDMISDMLYLGYYHEKDRGKINNWELVYNRIDKDENV